MQFPGQMNALSLPQIDQQVQRKKIGDQSIAMNDQTIASNALAAKQQQREYSNQERAQMGQDFIGIASLIQNKGPQWYAENLPQITQQLSQYGLPVDKLPPAGSNPESILEGADNMLQMGRTLIGHVPPQDLSQDEVPYAQRGADGSIDVIAGGSASRAKPPASISEYDLYTEQELAQGRQPISFLDYQKEINRVRSEGRFEGQNSQTSAGDKVDVQNKYPRILAARSNLANLRDTSRSIAKNDTLKGGPGQGMLLSFTEQGQQFDKSVDTLFSHIQALTRIPGVGAQSDWEGRIAKAVLPTANDYPSVRESAINELESLLNELEDAAQRVISGDFDASMDNRTNSDDGFSARWAAASSGEVLRAPDGTLRKKP